jgi:hypothetical protein
MIPTAQIQIGRDLRASRVAMTNLGLLIATFVIVSGCNSPSEPEPVMPGAFLASAGTLYWSELTAEGTDRLIGPFRTSSGTALVVTDIALAPDGALFAVTRSQLYSVDRETAVATPVGSSLPDETSALCFDAAGELYAASAASGALYRVGRVTGNVTPITYGSSFLSNGDLVFARNGALLATVKRTGDAFDTLAAISPDNGVPTVVRSYLPDKMQGLCMVQGFIYGAAAYDRGLYSINHLNGAYKLIRRLAFEPSGA